MKKHIITAFLLGIFWIQACQSPGLEEREITISNVGEGWANNSVNTVIFRRNSLDSFQDYQFTAYYDPEGYMVLGKRKLGTSHWEISRTAYKGNVTDAHNTISIALDGEGFLHVSWDHHDNPLRYAKGTEPLSLELGEKTSMTGMEEENVTYPEFHRLPNGDLIFMYRSGASGRGNLVINRFDLQTRNWSQIHSNLIDGEGERNAYWQAFIDKSGTIHLSWVWRETWDVSTNHDLAYARTRDGGLTWENSSGEKYDLPIREESAEKAWEIPQNSSLINQTAMAADDAGNPYIVSYWAENGIPQYHVVYKENGLWNKTGPENRTKPFHLGGGGTKRIPISRPQLLVDSYRNQQKIYIIFRDEERGNKVSLAYCGNLSEGNWQIKDLTDEGVGQWEPTLDISLWKESKNLNVFLQNVVQIDGEGVSQDKSSPVRVLEINK